MAAGCGSEARSVLGAICCSLEDVVVCGGDVGEVLQSVK
jgi:hypothetical protein